MIEIQDFLDYFLAPWKSGYDIPKTLTYGVILVLAVYLIFTLLRKLKVKTDKRLAIAISPYVIFGGTLRVLQDANLIDSYWFITPGVYFLITFIVISVLLLSLFIEKKKNIPYFKTQFVFGLVLVSFSVIFLQPVNFESIYLITIFFMPWLLILVLFKRFGLTNKLVASTQLFDATTTFVSINFFGYSEQHVLPTFLVNVLSPTSFIFLKVVVVIAILFLIDKLSDDKELNNYLKLIIGILGGATGIRDFMRLLLLV